MYVRLGDSAGQSVSEALNSVSTILKTAAPTAATIYTASILKPAPQITQQTMQPTAASPNSNSIVLVLGALAVGGVILALVMSNKSSS